MTESKSISESKDETYNLEAIETAKSVIEKEKIDSPLLSEHEKEQKNGNLLALQRYEDNAYRLAFDINKPDADATDAHLRLASFDRLMEKIQKAGLKIHHHGWDDDRSGPGYSYWEFQVGTEYYHEKLPDQATVLEICEMIAQKIGVELDV